MLFRVEIICFQTEKFSRHRLACTKNGTFSAYYGEEGGRVASRRRAAAANVIIEALRPTDRTFRPVLPDGKFCSIA